ncbi:MAG: serpin family protein, partial [Candidatus Limnocylindria bacterium]
GRAAAAAVEAFAADLYRELAASPGNLAFSPYSVAVALAMGRAGAVGETADQMDAVLYASLAGDLDAGFNALEQALAARPGTYPIGDDTAELELATANRLWGQRGFDLESAYLDRLAAYYGAGLHLVDYIEAREEARSAINDWVAERTRERIPELIPEGVLDELTRLVLTNAIYLKARWAHPFAEGGTSPGAFHHLDGSETQAQLMSLNAKLRYGQGSGYQVVELPYVGGLSMVVVVPDADEFGAFEQSLDGARMREVVDALRETQVYLALPRFEFRSQRMLKAPLEALGMPIAFTDDADFSGMSPQGKDLLIQEVVHEAFISVDEEGTEAAAATAVVFGLTSAPLVSVQLTVDRPFLFLIRDDETGAVLFLGRVVEPR